MKIEVMTIADDVRIQDIFRYKRWTIGDGIDYLVGIYKVRELDGFHEVTTLDGKIYREPEHAKEIHELFEIADRLQALWDHGIRKGIEYHPAIFVRWGLRYRDAAKLDWLSDAQNKNLVPHSVGKPKEKSEKELTPNERTSLLKIIAGLSAEMYGLPIPRQGLRTMIGQELEKHGVGLHETTRNKFLKEAWELLPRNYAQAKPH